MQEKPIKFSSRHALNQAMAAMPRFRTVRYAKNARWCSLLEEARTGAAKPPSEATAASASESCRTASSTAKIATPVSIAKPASGGISGFSFMAASAVK